jgi:hypothetical protein
MILGECMTTLWKKSGENSPLVYGTHSVEVTTAQILCSIQNRLSLNGEHSLLRAPSEGRYSKAALRALALSRVKFPKAGGN